MGVLLAIVAFLCGVTGDRNSQKRVWVECKNRRASIKRADIAKLLSSVEDVKARVGSKRAGAIDEVWYATTAGYDFDAVNLAREKCVDLYLAVNRPEGTMFERVY